MATERLRYLIEAIWSGKGATISASKDIENVGKAAKTASTNSKTGFQQIGAAAKTANEGIMSLVSGYGALTVGVVAAVGAIKKAWAALGEGADLERSREQFNRLAESIGADADMMLQRMTEATGGLQTQAQLVAGAGQIMSLGLADTEDGVIRLQRLIGELGWDSSQVILTFANNSKMRLDALGLSVEDVNARMKELQKSGMSMDQAFDMAVIEAGEAKLKLLGSAAETTVGQMKKAEVALAGIKDEALLSAVSIAEMTGAIDALVDTADDLTLIARAIALIREETAKGSGGQVDFLGSLADTAGLGNLKAIVDASTGLLDFIFNARDAQAEAAEEARKFATAEAAAADAALLLNRDATDTGFSLRIMTDAMKEGGDAAVAYAEAQKRLESGWTIQAQRIAETERILHKYGLGLGDTTIQIEEMAYASGELGNTEERLQGYLEDTTKATTDQVAAMAALAEARKAAAIASGDYFTAAMEAEKGTGFFNEALDDLGERTYFVSDLTKDQSKDLADLKDAYDDVTKQIHEYEIGLRGATMEDEKRADKLKDLRAEQAALAGSMAPLEAVGGVSVTVDPSATINMDAVNASLYETADAAGASASQLAILGGALGIFDDEAVEAALQSALISEKIQQLAEDFVNGETTVAGMRTELEDFITWVTGLGTEDLLNPADVLAAGDHVFFDPVAAKEDAETAAMEAAVAANQAFTDNVINKEDMQAAVDEGFAPFYEEVDATIQYGEDNPVVIFIDTSGATSDLESWRSQMAAALTIPVSVNLPAFPNPIGHAAGGGVSGGVPTIVGEQGPEIFVPQTAGMIIPNHQMGGGNGGGGVTFNVQVFAAPGMSPAALINQMRWQVNQMGFDLRGT